MGDLLQQVAASVIGDGHLNNGPYGPRPVVYADHAATGRSLAWIEDLMRAHVLPWYGNTHSERAPLTTGSSRWLRFATGSRSSG